ncbi:MAG TPA: hypothetical protein VN706_15435 [Gemmatimonadaceae bacterium]|nr:hypothetical protein [Gemmatimonadaceae bacterium]
MSAGRPWYREPETFIAIAALVVSLTAVVVGVYEAWLQRAHDRAEVWPHLEIQTWVGDSGAKLDLDNTGLGPAVVHYVSVTVDGKPQRNWDVALATLFGHTPPPHSNATVYQHALRPGDHTEMVGFGAAYVPKNFFEWAGRVTVTVCYSSVFEEYWMLTDTLGKSNKWETVKKCPEQGKGTDL